MHGKEVADFLDAHPASRSVFAAKQSLMNRKYPGEDWWIAPWIQFLKPLLMGGEATYSSSRPGEVLRVYLPADVGFLMDG